MTATRWVCTKTTLDERAVLIDILTPPPSHSVQNLGPQGYATKKKMSAALVECTAIFCACVMGEFFYAR